MLYIWYTFSHSYFTQLLIGLHGWEFFVASAMQRARGGIGIHNRLESKLSALLETVSVELLKFGETCKMAIPSQALQREGVETRRAAPKAIAMVKV